MSQPGDPSLLAGTESTPESLQIRPRNCLSETELGGYLSGLIHLKERPRLQRHLRACKECRQVIAFYARRKDEFAAVLPSKLR